MTRVSSEAVWALAAERSYFVRRRNRGPWMAARRLDGEWKNIGETNAEAFAWLEGMLP